MAIARHKNDRTVVLLDETRSDMVTVLPLDRDAFCLDVAKAVKACRILDDSYTFIRQVGDLRDELAKWIESHKAQVQAAYLPFRQTGILFVVVQREVQRDDALSEALTDLDIRIASGAMFNLLSVDVLMLPHSSGDATQAFLASGNVHQYAGQE